jgi:hypothetical protein
VQPLAGCTADQKRVHHHHPHPQAQELAVRAVQLDILAVTVVHMGLHPTHG